MYIELYVWLKFDIFALTKRLWKLHLIGSVPIKHSLYFPYNYHQFTKFFPWNLVEISKKLWEPMFKHNNLYKNIVSLFIKTANHKKILKLGNYRPVKQSENCLAEAVYHLLSCDQFI